MPLSDLQAVIKGDDVFITRGNRSYRVRNLDQNASKNVLKMNLFAYFQPVVAEALAAAG